VAGDVVDPAGDVPTSADASASNAPSAITRGDDGIVGKEQFREVSKRHLGIECVCHTGRATPGDAVYRLARVRRSWASRDALSSSRKRPVVVGREL
jgi:hypothetical protein